MTLALVHHLHLTMHNDKKYINRHMAINKYNHSIYVNDLENAYKNKIKVISNNLIYNLQPYTNNRISSENNFP